MNWIANCCPVIHIVFAPVQSWTDNTECYWIYWMNRFQWIQWMIHSGAKRTIEVVTTKKFQHPVFSTFLTVKTKDWCMLSRMEERKLSNELSLNFWNQTAGLRPATIVRDGLRHDCVSFQLKHFTTLVLYFSGLFNNWQMLKKL